MRNEIKINDQIRLIITKDDFGYSEVIDTFEKSKLIRVVTYNISKESNDLIKKLEVLEKDKNVIVITNIPNRFETYTSDYAKKRARNTIHKYIERLNPDNYSADVRTFFNFDNHSKIIMTDHLAYIGSSNFSDESKKSMECGVLISDEEIIREIDRCFVQMLVDDSEEYFIDGNVVIMLSNLLSQTEIYCEQLEESFYVDSGHSHRGLGLVYNYTDAELSPVLVENIVGLVSNIQESLEYLLDNEVFESIDLSLLENIRDMFDYDSKLEIFSRFNIEDKTQELFYEYLETGDPEFLDDYAQEAANKTLEISMGLSEEIHDEALNAISQTRQLVDLLMDTIDRVKKKRVVNDLIDNT